MQIREPRTPPATKVEIVPQYLLLTLRILWYFVVSFPAHIFAFERSSRCQRLEGNPRSEMCSDCYASLTFAHALVLG